MKILVISPSYPPAATGEAEHCLQISARLAARGHAVTVLCNLHPRPLRDASFELRAVARGWGWRELPALIGQLRSVQPDAVLLIYTGWLFDEHPMITFLAQYLRRWSPHSSLSVVVEVPDASRSGSLAVRLGRKLMTRLAGGAGVDFNFGTLLRDSRSVLVLGPSILANLTPRCADLQQRAHILPPPPLLRMPADRSEATRQATRSRLGAQPGETLLAYFGFVLVDKGIDTLLNGLKRLRDSGQAVRLLMAGGGREIGPDGPVAGNAHEAEMMRLCTQLGLDGVVSWSGGYDSGSDQPALELQAADIAVLPFSDGAQLRRSSIAAVASLGLPIVTTRPTALEAAFVDGLNVAFFEAGDVEGLTRAVTAVVQDPQLRGLLKQGAAQLARDWFSWDLTIDRLMQSFGAGNRPGA